MLNSYWSDLLDPKDPLIGLRQKGWDRFMELGLPRPKEEAFQYWTRKWEFPPLAVEPPSFPLVADLLFVDGFFQERKIAAPLVCLPLEKAIHSYGLFLQNRVSRSFKEEKDPFAALNGAFHGRGAFLYVPPQCKAALHGLQLGTCGEMASPRLHVYLGRGASLELRQFSEGKSGFSNGFFDCILDEGASLDFIDRSEGDLQAVRMQLKRNSRVKAVFLGRQERRSIHVQLAEENSEVELFGLARLKGKEASHVHATVEHAAPHTRSRQHFKSVLQEESRFSFEGKIWVHPAAQKTEAYQLNNNLLLSDGAASYAKPNLEIFADDVKASHGATVGRLDEEHLFYLRSRGLSLAQAKEWLVEGFCKEILDHAR